MIKFFQLIIYLFLGSIYAQNTTIITYQVQTNEPLMSTAEKAENPSIVALFDRAEKAFSSMKFELLIKNDTSKFSLLDAMQIDKVTYEIAKGLVDDSEYFRSGSTAIVKHFSYDKSYFVNFNVTSNWNISTENKMINGNLCYKATTLKVVQSKDKARSFPVTAWFCPKIPFPFGPKNYGDLPGLILELSEGRITFLATKLEFNKKIENEIIPNFKNSKIYTEEEFKILARENTKKVQENSGLKIR